MIITEVSTKTRTVIDEDNGVISVDCYSDLNANANTNPSVYKSDVLNGNMEIDSINGIEGELIVSHDPELSDVKINENGDFEISVENDNVNNYTINNENLIYNE